MLSPRNYVTKVVRRVRGLPPLPDDRVLGDDGKRYPVSQVEQADAKFARDAAARRSRRAGPRQKGDGQ